MNHQKNVIALLLTSMLLLCLFSGTALASDAPVTLSFLNLNPESGPIVDEIVSDFMALNPGIIIEHEYMNSRQYDQKIQSLAASNDLPDIMTVQMFTQYRQMAKDGLLMDLRDTDIITGGRFSDVALTALQIEDGTVFGTTWCMMGVGAFYNIDLFDQHGLKIPTTWEEFLNVCDTLKSAGVTPIVSSLGDDWTTMYPNQCFITNYAYPDNPDYDNEFVAGVHKFNSEPWIHTFTNFKLMYDSGYFGDSPMGGKYEQSLSDFANGKAAMQIIGNWVIPVYRELNPDLNFSFFPIPVLDSADDLYAVFESELGMGIAAGSSHQAEALTFFEYFYSPDVYAKFLNGKKGFSAVTDVDVEFDECVSYINKNFVITGKMYPYVTRLWPAGGDLQLYKMTQEMLMGTKSIEQALDEMDVYYAQNK